MSPRAKAIAEVLIVTVVTTGIVTGVAKVVPEKYVATTVGFVFLAMTWAFVWRKDDAFVEEHGLALGGLVLPGPLPFRRLLRSAAVATGVALAAALVVFVPFTLGFRRYWHIEGAFHFPFTGKAFANEAFGQLVIIALPEEAFYRGYVQSRLANAMGDSFRVRIFGTDVSLAIVITSALFAAGHLATIHSPVRLAVFFPSLLFGLLRARTKGIGAGVLFHAMCNVFSETLGKGYGLY